jgi:RimJ/RimL family protein N-acetyltransferase
MLEITPVTLSTNRLLLRPLERSDETALIGAASDGSLWEKRTTTVPRPEEMRAYIEKALSQAAAGTALPFTTVVRDGDLVVGSTRYMNIDPVNHRVEIGTTWIAQSWQRSFVNTHAKFLLLRHAFETLGCIAVELRTHSLNHQSRQAIERLGAKQDGLLRRHMIMPDGHIRDTVVYSIIREEWPLVKEELSRRLGADALATS